MNLGQLSRPFCAGTEAQWVGKKRAVCTEEMRSATRYHLMPGTAPYEVRLPVSVMVGWCSNVVCTYSCSGDLSPRTGGWACWAAVKIKIRISSTLQTDQPRLGGLRWQFMIIVDKSGEVWGLLSEWRGTEDLVITYSVWPKNILHFAE